MCALVLCLRLLTGRIRVSFGFNLLGLDIFRVSIYVDGLELTDWGQIIRLKQVV